MSEYTRLLLFLLFFFRLFFLNLSMGGRGDKTHLNSLVADYVSFLLREAMLWSWLVIVLLDANRRKHTIIHVIQPNLHQKAHNYDSDNPVFSSSTSMRPCCPPSLLIGYLPVGSVQSCPMTPSQAVLSAVSPAPAPGSLPHRPFTLYRLSDWLVATDRSRDADRPVSNRWIDRHSQRQIPLIVGSMCDQWTVECGGEGGGGEMLRLLESASPVILRKRNLFFKKRNKIRVSL